MTANLISLRGRFVCATKYGSKEWLHASLSNFTLDERQSKSKKWSEPRLQRWYNTLARRNNRLT